MKLCQNTNYSLYVIKPLDGRKTKTVHINLLLKVNDLPIETFKQNEILKVPENLHIPKTMVA